MDEETMDGAHSNMESLIGSQILENIKIKQPGNLFNNNKQEVNNAYGAIKPPQKKQPIRRESQKSLKYNDLKEEDNTRNQNKILIKVNSNE